MSEIDQLYQATIVDHDREPRNCHPLAHPTHEATLDNPLCGDVVTLQLQIVDGVIRDVAFDGRGCALSRAAASIMTTLLRDLDASQAQALADRFGAFVRSAPEVAIPPELGELGAFAGVRRFRSRQACARLPFGALAAALARS